MPDADVRPAPLVSPDWDTHPFAVAPGQLIHPQHDHAYCWQVLYEDGTSLWEVNGERHHVVADIDPARAVALRLHAVQPGHLSHAVQLHRTQPLPDGSPPQRDDRRVYFRRTAQWVIPFALEDGPVEDAVRLDWHVAGWTRPDGSGCYLYISPDGESFLSDAPNEV